LIGEEPVPGKLIIPNSETTNHVFGIEELFSFGA